MIDSTEKPRRVGDHPERDVVLAEVMRHVTVLADVDPEYLNPAYSFGHLGLETLEIVEVVVQTEAELHLTGLSDVDIEGVKNVDGLVEIICTKSVYAPNTALQRFMRFVDRFELTTLMNRPGGKWRRWLRRLGIR